MSATHATRAGTCERLLPIPEKWEVRSVLTVGQPSLRRGRNGGRTLRLDAVLSATPEVDAEPPMPAQGFRERRRATVGMRPRRGLTCRPCEASPTRMATFFKEPRRRWASSFYRGTQERCRRCCRRWRTCGRPGQGTCSLAGNPPGAETAWDIPRPAAETWIAASAVVAPVEPRRVLRPPAAIWRCVAAERRVLRPSAELWQRRILRVSAELEGQLMETGWRVLRPPRLPEWKLMAAPRRVLRLAWSWRQ